jgi:hypothetical protein
MVIAFAVCLNELGLGNFQLKLVASQEVSQRGQSAGCKVRNIFVRMK